MSDQQYTYAVARIRSKELTLLNAQFLDQLLSAKSYDECLHMLIDKGWGYDTPNPTAEQLLVQEREKMWGLIGELVDDMSVFDVFLYANDYHNLKAAIKLVCTDADSEGIFIRNGTVEPELMVEAVKKHKFLPLPEAMRKPAEEAYTALVQTRDGQLCDIIIDRAALETIAAAGRASNDALIREYAELTVASADIKTAVRCNKTGKSFEFITRALAPCETLNVTALARAAVESLEAICNCLSTTDYAAAVPALQESPSAFERWCDNLIIEHIRPQQYKSFGLGPLAAYVLAKENEIKSVRIILSGKLNDLPEGSIRERIREMYV